jgi:hypothetical protein
MKYRSSKNVKKEHGMIDGLPQLLETIGAWDEVKSIIPGRIKPISKGQPLHIRIQYETIGGLKCLGFSGSAAREVFITTTNTDVLKIRLEQFIKSRM